MDTMRWRGTAVAVAITLGLSSAALAQANLENNPTYGSEVQSATLDVAITQYGQIDVGLGILGISNLLPSHLDGAGAPATVPDTTVLLGSLDIITEANTVTNFAVPVTMTLTGGSGGQTLTADCELLRFPQATYPFGPATGATEISGNMVQSATPSGSNDYSLEVSLDPQKAANAAILGSPQWTVLLQAGDYTGTVTVTMSATTPYTNP